MNCRFFSVKPLCIVCSQYPELITDHTSPSNLRPICWIEAYRRMIGNCLITDRMYNTLDFDHYTTTASSGNVKDNIKLWLMQSNHGFALFTKNHKDAMVYFRFAIKTYYNEHYDLIDKILILK
jgi:hypothetical protein